MKQSTSFAQVATNQFDYLSSDLCANTPPCKKHSSSRKFLTLSISLRLLLVMFLTLSVTTNAWSAEGDKHTFTDVKFEKLLNNSATISDVTISDPGYPVKTIIVNCRYNKTAGGVTISIKIGGKTFASSKTHNSSNTVDIEFTDEAMQGDIVFSFVNNCGSGTGKGTFYFNSVTLVEAAPAAPCTVTLKDDNSTLTQSSAGKSVTLPSREGCDGYTFVGWTKSWSVAQTTWTTTAPAIIPVGSYTPTSDENLYPVYTKTVTSQGGGSGNYELVTSAPDDWSGTYLIVDGTSENCFNGSLTKLDAGGNYVSVTISNNKITSNTTTDSYSVTISKSTTNGKYYIKTSSGYYIGSNATDSSKDNELDASTSTKYDNSISISSNNVTIKGPDHILKFFYQSGQSWRFRFYKSTTTTNVRLPQLYKKSSGTTTTTSYISVPNCCTQLAEVTGLKYSNITSNGITVSVPTTYSDKENVSGYTFNCYSASTGGTLIATADESGTSHTFTGLTKNTTYYFTVIAKGKGDYCNSVETSPRESSKTLAQYTVTLNLNGGTGTFTGWTANGDNYTMTVDAGTDITLPEPSKTDYDFTGWYDETQIVTSPYTPTKDVTLTAQWTSNKTATSLSWSATSCSATIDADNTFPALTVEPEAIKESVQYTSSDKTIATIDANGTITLLKAGTTTITASYDEDEDYLSASASYTLTVHPSNCRWVETEIGEIESGDEVVITMTKENYVWTISNPKNTSTAPNANDITAYIQDKHLTLVPNEYKWVIEKDNANLTFYSYSDNANYLYCTNAENGNGVRVGAGTAKVFVVDGNYLKNIETTSHRYLGVSQNTNPYSWRCYTETTGVIKDQTLKFYKRECLDSEHYWVTWDAGEGLWTDGSSKKLESYEVGAAITKPADPSREGYRFDGWTPTPGTMPAENKTFTAQWAELHTITWMVGSSSVLTEEVANGTGVTKTPTNTPVNNAIGDCADTFMGWTETPLGSTEGQSAPADLCTAAQMKTKHSSVTSDKTFYAVFATKSSGGGENTAQVFATSSLGNSNSVTTGYAISADAEKKTGYYQDGSGTKRYVQVMKSDVSTPMISNAPTSVTITTKLGGGTTRADLTNSVYAIWLDKDGKELGNAVLITDEITATTGSDFTVNLPIADATSAYGVMVYHQKESGYNVRYYGISLSYKYNNTTYSNYVTNCCALAPATNLTVSGTTANSATLTWTAPSSTTGITKLQVRNAATDEVVVNNIAVNTTTATITGLTECTSYQYYVVSVGEDCEVVSNIVTAQPFGNAKTVNYNYNGGSGSVTSFTTSCTNQTITLPAATRTGYDFNGWYTDATGGTRVGGANDTYEPATSPVTLHAQWTIKSYTVTWNPNGGNWGGNTSNIVETYEYGAIIDTPEDPKRENGIFKGWSPNPESPMPASDKTYTAQWDMVYTLTFVDMNAGGTTTTLTQTSSGQNIVAPTANSEVCDMWTFIGWAPSNSLNGGTDKPTGFIAAGETILGSQITGNKTYYSVYSYNSDNTQEFEVGKSGTYLMYALSSGTKYYATTAKTGGFYGNPETSFATYGGPSKFTLTYNKTEEKYIIYHENTTSGKESQGYFELNTSDGEVDVKSETPSLFTIQAGSNGAFIIRTDYSNKERSFGYDGSFTDYSGDNPIYFEPASEIQYYNAANCGEVETYTMSFHNPFGDEDALIWYDAEHEESYYTNKPLNTSIDVFPTMVYNGWIFIGWTANQQYNELIGEENLDDENSATNDPASSLTIYSNTAGWAYTLNDNVTMYPVFTKYEDNEDVDLSSGGEYYMYFYRDASYYEDEYFGADNHYQRMYASSVALNSGAFTYTTLCNNAQIFEFIKKGDGWNIRLKNADGTYPAKSYLVNTIENDYAVQSAEPSETWGVSKNPGGDYLMWYRGNSKNTDENNPHYRAKARELGGTSWSFKCYNKDNDASNFYYEVYLGTCENRVFSSNPSNKPIIQLSGDVYVTATNARGVMATSTLKVSARKLNANEQVNITSNSNDVYFSADCTVNFVKANKPTNTLTITASPSGVIEQDIYVHYKPSAEGNGTPASVVVSANLATPNPSVTDDQTIHVRNLPAKFVIATKVGATWYALPADMSSATNPLGVVIEVDETTMTTIAPNTTTYTLWPVKTTATENDRYTNVTGVAYGDRVRFAAVNYEQRGLWANNNNNGSTIRDYAKIDALGADALAAYEWKVTTTVVDGHWQYTLQTDQTQNQNYLRYWVGATGAPKWGTYAAGNNQLYFLPVTETEPFDYKVVEWYPTKMLIQTDATIANPTAEIGDAQINNVTCTNKGSKLYEIAGLPLENNPTKVLTIKFSDGGNNYTNATTIPVIISRSTTNMSGEPFVTLTKDVYNYADLVVRDGATLTINGETHAENTFFNVTIYPTSKISVPEGKKLTVHSLTFFGGIDEIYNGSTYTLNKYGVPELSLKGTLKKSISTIDYLMRVDSKQMYSLTVPYDVQLADIKYWDGTNIVLGDELWVSAYDGASRAQNQGNGKNWIYETDFNPATLKFGVGYTISAELQAGVGKEYSILRMPMNSNVVNEASEVAKSVAVTAHGIEANITDNHKGWNLVGNPYMTTIKGADDADLVLGYLKETGTGPWEWVNDGIRYVTIPSDDGTYYRQKTFTEAVLPPFKNFFVQVGTTGELQFGLGTRQSMPARSTQAAIEKEVEFEILMSNATRQDNTGLLISKEYSPAYEINADLEKMIGSMSVYTIYGGYKLAYNALSPINASEWIPMGYIAPAAGEYTFRLDDIDKIAEQVEHVYIIDYNANNIVDLMDEEYKFTTDKEQNDNRFAINVVLVQDKDNTTTGLDIIQGNNAAPIKFIHQDKMYIYNEGIIYDATGKQVTNINK